jgi:general secretion pathway protein E
MSDAIRAAVTAHKDAHAVERIGIEEGMRTMFQHGIARVMRGETTFEEVLRVCSTL